MEKSSSAYVTHAFLFYLKNDLVRIKESVTTDITNAFFFLFVDAGMLYFWLPIVKT